jgi:hypothetical protein
MNPQLSVVKPYRGEDYQKALDGCKKRIRGLWEPHHSSLVMRNFRLEAK